MARTPASLGDNPPQPVKLHFLHPQDRAVERAAPTSILIGVLPDHASLGFCVSSFIETWKRNPPLYPRLSCMTPPATKCSALTPLPAYLPLPLPTNSTPTSTSFPFLYLPQSLTAFLVACLSLLVCLQRQSKVLSLGFPPISKPIKAV